MLKTLYKIGKTKALMRKEYENNPEWFVVFHKTINNEDFCMGMKTFTKNDMGNIIEKCDQVNRAEIIDKTNQGYFCIQCKKFSEKPQMVLKNKETYYVDNVWILVNDHYDGCRGWD